MVFAGKEADLALVDEGVGDLLLSHGSFRPLSYPR